MVMEPTPENMCHELSQPVFINVCLHLSPSPSLALSRCLSRSLCLCVCLFFDGFLELFELRGRLVAHDGADVQGCDRGHVGVDRVDGAADVIQGRLSPRCSVRDTM